MKRQVGNKKIKKSNKSKGKARPIIKLGNCFESKSTYILKQAYIVRNFCIKLPLHVMEVFSVMNIKFKILSS